MPIEATFGARSNRFNNAGNLGTATEQTTEKKKAEFWLNPGYTTDSEKYPFVSLPQGLPLNLDDRKDLKGSPEYVNLLAAQNELLEDIIEQARMLAPGEDMVVMMPVQIRRVAGEREAPASANNPLSRRGQLFQALDMLPSAGQVAE